MKRVVAVAVLTCVVEFIGASSSEAQIGDSGPTVEGRALDSYAELLAEASADGSRRTAKGVSLNAPRVVRRYVPACSGNSPSGASLDALCAGRVNACTTTADPDDLLFWVFTAPAGPPAPSPEDFTYANEAVCRSPAEVPEAVVPVFTAEDFRRLPLPAGGVHVEPPNLRTLINVPTNVYVDADRVIIPTELLGFPVRVRATPARFIWRFGDGGKLATTDAGAPYPDLRTTHTYTRPGRARVRLTTVYSGEYSVAGGPWLPIDGTAQVDSPGRVLTVLAAENRLVVE